MSDALAIASDYDCGQALPVATCGTLLLQVRKDRNVTSKEGIDCLLALLLSRLHMSGPLDDLMRENNHVLVDQVQDSLKRTGNQHALALLLAYNGRITEALDTWRVRLW